MRRSLILLLLVIVLAGYLGTLIARDPGYVLITYDGFSMQTSLWVLLGILAGISAAVYLLLRTFNIIRKSPAVYQGWRASRKSAKADKLTSRGLMLLAEGESERARRFLESGATDSHAKGINYLAAARAANDMGDDQARETFLRMAEESDSGLARARAIVAAELALDRDDSDAALTMLNNIKPNRHVLRLKQRALSEKGSVEEMLSAIREIQKADPAGAAALEMQAALSGLKPGDDNAVNALFRSLSASSKQSPEIITRYVDALENDEYAEPLLRSTIRKNWQPALVERYGDLNSKTLKVRKKTAERWRKTHENDASLQYCLGAIYEQADEKNLAKEAYRKSIDLGGPTVANERLANLLSDEGEFERSNEQLRLALQKKA
jgi:HemY protein